MDTARVKAPAADLQFQDIAAQQSQGVADALLDLEARVTAVAGLLDRTLGTGEPGPAPAPSTAVPAPQLAFNPQATMRRAGADQSLIDQTLEGARHGQPAERAGRTGH